VFIDIYLILFIFNRNSKSINGTARQSRANHQPQYLHFACGKNVFYTALTFLVSKTLVNLNNNGTCTSMIM